MANSSVELRRSKSRQPSVRGRQQEQIKDSFEVDQRLTCAHTAKHTAVWTRMASLQLRSDVRVAPTDIK